MKLRGIIGVALTAVVLTVATGCNGSDVASLVNSDAVNRLGDIISKGGLTVNILSGEDKSTFHKEEETNSEKSEEDIESVKISVVNNLGYDIDVAHISPVEKDTWGEVAFGDAKNGYRGDVTLSLLSGSDTYDILITDTDEDNYIFNDVEIKDGYRLEFSWESDIKVEIFKGQRQLATEYGEFDAQGSFDEVYGEEQEMPYDITGEDTQGKVAFTVYNESPYNVYNVYFGPKDGSIEDIDILGPEDILSPDVYSYPYSATLPRDQWENVEWTLFVVDEEGDTSYEYDICNPYALLYADIMWDVDLQGYVVNCYYNSLF